MEEFGKEIAKMCIDITKYLITVVLIATTLGDLADVRLVFVLGFALSTAFLFMAYLIFSVISKRKNEQNKKNKR